MAGNKDELPSVSDFGQMRAKLARRGIPQAWIDKYLGTGINGRTRGQIDLDLREGYVTGQLNVPNAIGTVLVHLVDQGWDAAPEPGGLRVTRSNGEVFDMLGEYLMDCDFSDLPGPLAADVRQALQNAGYC